jgi:hypothetical protein
MISKLQVALGKRIGLYKFTGDLGRGNFSRVRLGINQLTKGKYRTLSSLLLLSHFKA